MPEDKKSKFVQAVVDRVVSDVVVAVICHPDASEDEPDTFKEIYIPGERFKDFPNEGDIIPIDPDKPDVITVNVGNTIYCEVLFFMAYADNEQVIFKYEEKHAMSGLYNDADDIAAILAARRKFWKAANDDKFSLERKNPDKQIYFSKSTYWTDKCQDKELFTAFVRQIAFKGYANNIQFEAVKFGSERIPNKF